MTPSFYLFSLWNFWLETSIDTRFVVLIRILIFIYVWFFQFETLFWHLILCFDFIFHFGTQFIVPNSNFFIYLQLNILTGIFNLTCNSFVWTKFSFLLSFWDFGTKFQFCIILVVSNRDFIFTFNLWFNSKSHFYTRFDIISQNFNSSPNWSLYLKI